MATPVQIFLLLGQLGSGANVSVGPGHCVIASQVFAPGMIEGELFQPGDGCGEIHSPGMSEGEAFQAGSDAAEIFQPGSQKGQANCG